MTSIQKQVEDVLSKHPSYNGYVLNEDHDGYYNEDRESCPKNFIYTLFVYDQENVHVYECNDYLFQPREHFTRINVLTIPQIKRFYGLNEDDFKHV